ncbi:hypothetical protein CPB83DRAFT_841015 [Crepidotus variabilis]|uniref:Uncharacterized protein n=1 Tax=Crepidotus variabilis TaxID=179855 RepID=A0A9P6E3B9_9AGAR|nr:hypothetical protein CPB83DRAFT_841015 [Crepidotus variabilis]
MSRVTPQNSAQFPACNLLTWSLWESNSDKICNFAAEGYYCLEVNETLGVKFPRFMPEICAAHWQKRAFYSLRNASKITSNPNWGEVNGLFFWLFAVLMGKLNALQMSSRGITILGVPTSLISSWSTWCNVSACGLGFSGKIRDLSSQ